MKDPHQMAFTEMKQWLGDRLQMRGSAAVDIDLRRDEAPYERPVELWKSGSDEFRNDFRRALMDLIAEAGARPWAPEHFHELGLLVEAAALWEAVTPLESIAQSRRLLKHKHGLQLHMLSLRTLLALGWKGTVDFWLAQKELIGQGWPGIIFEGLAQQDVELAFDSLPELISSRESMHEVLSLFPGLMRDLKLSMTAVRERCSRVHGILQPDAAETMTDWFRLRNYPLKPPVNGSLAAAIEETLMDESAPRSLSAKLCGRPNSNLACA